MQNFKKYFIVGADSSSRLRCFKLTNLLWTHVWEEQLLEVAYGTISFLWHRVIGDAQSKCSFLLRPESGSSQLLSECTWTSVFQLSAPKRLFHWSGGRPWRPWLGWPGGHARSSRKLEVGCAPNQPFSTHRDRGGGLSELRELEMKNDSQPHERVCTFNTLPWRGFV